MTLKITRGPRPCPARVILGGVEGIGKTTLASQFPEAIILDTEDGSNHLDVARVRCDDFAAVESAMHELVRDRQGFRTVVVDSADWAERSLIEQIVRHAGKKSIEDFGFGKGYTIVAERVAKFLALADQLIDAGLHVVFVAHVKVQRTSPPDMQDGYDRYELKLTKQTAPLFKEWADAILFCNYKTKIVEGGDGRMKAIGGRERVIYTSRTAAWDAKNRYGLKDELPMTIDALSPVLAGTGLAATADRKPPTLRERIAAASTALELVAVRDVVDDQESKGRLTDDQVAVLRGLIDAKFAELEPVAEEATA